MDKGKHVLDESVHFPSSEFIRTLKFKRLINITWKWHQRNMMRKMPVDNK